MRGKTLDEYITFFDESFGEELPDLAGRWKARMEAAKEEEATEDEMITEEEAEVPEEADELKPEVEPEKQPVTEPEEEQRPVQEPVRDVYKRQLGKYLSTRKTVGRSSPRMNYPPPNGNIPS